MRGVTGPPIREAETSDPKAERGGTRLGRVDSEDGINYKMRQ